MKISQKVQMSQQLVLTPALKQAIALLALPYPELCAQVAQECADNPFLELPQPQSVFCGDSLSQLADTARPTMASYLEQSLWESSLSQRTKHCIAALIEHIDEYGFLGRSHRDALSQKAQKQYVLWAQQLEPLGLGAANIYEGLRWQLERQLHSPAQYHLLTFLGAIERAEMSLHDKESFFASLENAHSGISQQVDKIFQSLEVYPARAFQILEPNIPQAELLLVGEPGHYTVQLNEELIPQMRLQPSTGKEMDLLYQQAKTFKKMVATRYHSLLKVARFLVAKQQDFFHIGDAALQPLQLKDVALSLGLHESTISRVVQAKYLWGAQGFIPLKKLFVRKVAHGDHGSVSTSHVHSFLQGLMSHEDPYAPFSDQQLQHILRCQGYVLARRTIAKYREKLGFPCSRSRRLKS